MADQLPGRAEALRDFAASFVPGTPATHPQDFDGAAPGPIDLQGCGFQGASFRHADLTGANLSEADLTQAECAGVILNDARLEQTILRGADLAGASLQRADAGQACFADALLEDANAAGARFRFADFTKAVLDGADLSGADFWGAQMAGAVAQRVRLRGALLDECKLAGADLAGADLTGATLRRADLSGTNLTAATLRDAALDGANLHGADFSQAVLPHLVLTGCNLTHVKFAGAWLERTRMRARQLGGACGEEAAGDYEQAIESYIVLEQNFRSLANAADASWAFRRRRRMGKHLHRQQAVSAWHHRAIWAATKAAAHWLNDIAAEALCDYGESLTRILRALAIVLVGCAIFYWLTGTLAPRPPIGRHELAAVDYLLFSLDSMTSVGTGEVALQPTGQLGVLISSLQTVVGTVLLGLFGFVLGVRMRN